MYKFERPQLWSIHGARSIFTTLILLLFVLYPSAAPTELWISDPNGSDSADCSKCSPCKTFQHALNVASGNDIIEVNLLPGSYDLKAAIMPIDNSTDFLSIIGHSLNPPCNSTSVLTSFADVDSVSITTCDLADASIHNLVVKSIFWSSPVVRLPRALSTLSLIDSSFTSTHPTHIVLADHDDPQLATFLFDRLTAQGAFHINTTSSQMLELSIKSSTFVSASSFQAHIRELVIDGSTFSDDLFVNNTNGAVRAVAKINRSNFLNETVLEFINVNATIRSCVFSRAVIPKTPKGYETNIFAANYANAWVDARGNYWGDALGPYSCCNPSSTGVFAMQADTDNWCLDDRCSALVSPINEAINLTFSSYTPHWCSYDAYCTPLARTVLISDGATVLILFVFCLIFLIVAKSKQKKIITSHVMSSRSFSQSGFNFEPVVDADAFRNRALMAFDIASIVVSVMVILSAWMPTHLAPASRYTLFAYLLEPWYFATGGTLTLISCARVATNIWHLIVISCSRPNYTSLMANVIVSSIVLQYAGLLRMAASLNDIGATGRYGAYFGPESGVVILPSGFLITFTTYHWVLWLISFCGELLLSTPVIVLSLQIIKKRDFNEISAIKKTIESNHLGSKTSLMRGPRLGRPAKIISWVSFVASLLFLGTFAFLVTTFLKRYFEQTSSFEASSFVEIMSIMTATVTRTLVVFNCMFVTFLCFIIFRWRFYEPALAMTAGALALGVACSTLEGATFFALSMKARGDISGAIVAGCVTVGLALTLFALAVTSFWYLSVMRKRLSSDVITSVYEQLEETYS